MTDHFARPLVGPDGKTPTHSPQTCQTCGKVIVRCGRRFASDGVRGQWRHKVIHVRSSG